MSDDSTTMDEDESREMGVEFGEFEDTMEEIDYPIDHEELVEQHGDAEFELPDGESTLEEILAPLEDDQQTYGDAGELETMIMNMVGDDAVGREGYSDRGDEAQQAEDDEQESF
jgi:6-pyruvoyl-tetrahydropterin synthase